MLNTGSPPSSPRRQLWPSEACTAGEATDLAVAWNCQSSSSPAPPSPSSAEEARFVVRPQESTHGLTGVKVVGLRGPFNSRSGVAGERRRPRSSVVETAYGCLCGGGSRRGGVGCGLVERETDRARALPVRARVRRCVHGDGEDGHGAHHHIPDRALPPPLFLYPVLRVLRRVPLMLGERRRRFPAPRSVSKRGKLRLQVRSHRPARVPEQREALVAAARCRLGYSPGSLRARVITEYLLSIFCRWITNWQPLRATTLAVCSFLSAKGHSSLFPPQTVTYKTRSLVSADFFPCPFLSFLTSKQ
ncbi:uncharacterized protein LOC119579452 [Penaeus monodon]|uniref:uncharacterized protein LOC119579452 n=1 Tax=Penaeus monodon TaxID=6687 RepID=UPI0018A76605|nr:uncharacterized protein LOC119579452 [Penaeus monodon]